MSNIEKSAAKGPPEFSDQDLTLKFVMQNCPRLRHCNELGGWLFYDGQRWVIDKVDQATELTSQFCRSVSAEVMDARPNDPAYKKIARDIASRRTVSAILKLAQGHRRIARTANQFDLNKHLLNTPVGTINLETGEVRAHDPEDHITRITKGKPGGNAKRFHRFLEEITLGDKELALYLQRLAGYWATASTNHQEVYFVIGPGENGKSNFMDSIKETLGEYAEVTAVDLFTKKPAGGHSTDYADLKGLRLAYSSETDGDALLSADKIKTFAGADPVKARKMHADNSEFRPECKFVLLGNHDPQFVKVDNGLRRRVVKIPFDFVPKKRDPFLKDKLFKDLDGILDWVLEGARLNAQEGGLGPKPKAVKKATSIYFAKSDAIAQWLHEYCHPDPAAKTPKTALYDSYAVSCSAIGATVVDRNEFFKQLTEKFGYVDTRMNGGGRALKGVAFRANPNPEIDATAVSDDPTGDTA